MTASPRPSFAAGRLEELASGPLSALSSMLQIDEFADGAEVLREGDSGDWLGVVLEGEGVVEKRIDGDGDVVEILAMVSRGDVIGEMAFVDKRPRSATVRARGRMQVARLPRAAFRSVMASDPESAEVLVGTLLSTLSSRLRDSTDALVALYQAGRQIGMARNVEDVSAAMLQQVSKAMPAATAGVVATWAGGTVKRLNGGTDATCQPVVGFGLSPTIPASFPVSLNGPLMKALLATPAGLVIGPSDPLAAEVAFFGAKWCLVTELVHDQRPLGIVALCSNAEQNPFLARHEVLVAVLANQAAAAIARYTA